MLFFESLIKILVHQSASKSEKSYKQRWNKLMALSTWLLAPVFGNIIRGLHLDFAYRICLPIIDCIIPAIVWVGHRKHNGTPLIASVVELVFIALLPQCDTVQAFCAGVSDTVQRWSSLVRVSVKARIFSVVIPLPSVFFEAFALEKRMEEKNACLIDEMWKCMS